MSYKKYLHNKKQKRGILDPVDIPSQLKELKAAEKEKVPMRVDSRTIILVDKQKATQERVENFKSLNEMFKKKYP
jgi:hypothetical protein